MQLDKRQAVSHTNGVTLDDSMAKFEGLKKIQLTKWYNVSVLEFHHSRHHG